MRYLSPVRPWPPLTLLLAACQSAPSDHTSFGSTPGITTVADTVADSTAGTSTTAAHTPDTTTGPDSDPTPNSTGEPLRDLGGLPDFGEDAPAGCKGKIDFLFVISRDSNMQYHQEQLALAFPQFIATIESKFADFDYHIMVVTGDDGWGNTVCNKVCPDLGCTVDEPCCPMGITGPHGYPCCPAPDYPCDMLDQVSTCDYLWGAGEIFPAGVDGEANKPCPVDGDRRYLVKGQTDLPGTFACIANVGASGDMALGQAMVAALQYNLNGPGGCNGGFLRDDALLMVTFIATNGDNPGSDSIGTPEEWAQAVLDAKHGDPESVVMFNIGVAVCSEDDRLCRVTKLFPFNHIESVLAPDYGPAFTDAADLVETACAGFTPPPR